MADSPDTPEAKKRERDPVVIGRLDALQQLWDMNPPTYPIADQIAQTQAYKGLIWLAVAATKDALQAATAQIMMPRTMDRLARMVAKAMPTTHAQASDDKFVPMGTNQWPAKLFKRPSPVESFAMFLARCNLMWQLHGRILIWGPKNWAGAPEKLYVLPTALMQPIAISAQYPRGGWRITQNYASGAYGALPYYLNPLGTIIPGEEVYDLKNPDPLYYWSQKSPVDACNVQVDLINIIDRSTWAVMNNEIDPSVVVTVPGANEDQATTIQNNIHRKHTGDNKGKAMVLGVDIESKGVTVAQLVSNARDMPNGDAWDRYASFTLAIFGVTMGIIGLKKENGSYSANWAEIQNWQVRKLQPFCAMIADFLTHGPIRDWGGEKRGLVLQIDLPKIADPELLETQIAADQAGEAITVNEQRALRGRKPFPGGDVTASEFAAAVQKKYAPEPPPMLAAAKPGEDKAAPKSSLNGNPQADPVARPDNSPAAKGSLPNRIAKALEGSMNTMVGSEGGDVVKVGEQRTAKRRVVRGKRAKRMLDGMMRKALSEG